MKKKSSFFFWTCYILIILGFFLWSSRDYPYSKAELLDSPEAAIAQEMAKIEPETTAEDIKILGQVGNNKESYILFECSGKPMKAFAIDYMFGLRYKLLIGDLTNSEDENGVQIYNPNLPVDFRVHDYFHEREYTYFENEITLTESTYSMHDDVGRVIMDLMLITVFLLANDHFRQYGKNKQ